MSQFSYTVFSLAVMFVIALALVSDKRFLRVEKMLFSLIFASVIFSSVSSLLRDGNLPDYSLPDGVVEENHAFDELMVDAVRRGVCEALKTEFSLSEEDFELTLSMVDEKTHLPGCVVVVLKNKGVFADTRGIEEYLKERGGFSDVRVNIRLRS